MPIRRYKPTSAGPASCSVSTFEEITKTTPEKSCSLPLTKKGGRNRKRRITRATRAAEHKRRLPPHRLQARERTACRNRAAIGYDPNRSARIALLHYADGAKATSSLLAAEGRRDGRVRPRPNQGPGTRCRFENIPTGTLVHNIELKPGQGARRCALRRRGRPARREDAGYAVLRLPSRRDAPHTAHVPRATVGRSGRRPPEHQLGQGRSPTAGGASVRQCAARPMNPDRPPARRREASRRAAAIRSPHGACRRSASAPARSTRNSDKLSSAASPRQGGTAAKCRGSSKKGLRGGS